MSRRKSEITSHSNERDFPHLVELVLPPGGYRGQSFEFNAFHHERGIPIRRGRGRHEVEQFRVRFCFPDAGTADAFSDRFGGVRLTYSPSRSGQRPSGPRLRYQRSYAPRVVGGQVPVKDLKELIALLKANPGKYSYASPGYGTTPHLACVWLFNLENGIDITHVPFRGAAPAVQSVLAGQTPVFHNVLPAVAPHIRAGAMRALAVAASKRTPYFPNVPTIAEAGYQGHEVAFWMGVFVPAGTPKDMIDVLNKQVARIMALPDVKERMATIGFDPTLSSSEELTAHMQAETEKWSKVVRQASIRID